MPPDSAPIPMERVRGGPEPWRTTHLLYAYPPGWEQPRQGLAICGAEPSPDGWTQEPDPEVFICGTCRRMAERRGYTVVLPVGGPDGQ